MADDPTNRSSARPRKRAGAKQQADDKLVGALTDVGTEIKGLRGDIQQTFLERDEVDKMLKKARRRTIAALIFAGIGFLISGVGAGFSGYNSLHNGDTIDFVGECIGPADGDTPHECFEEGQVRQVQAIQGVAYLDRSNILAYIDQLNIAFVDLEGFVPVRYPEFACLAEGSDGPGGVCLDPTLRELRHGRLTAHEESAGDNG